jgi:stringent starvation protein B
MMFEPEAAYDAELSAGFEQVEELEDNISLVHETESVDENSHEPSGDEPPRPPKGRPSLRVVK